MVIGAVTAFAIINYIHLFHVVICDYLFWEEKGDTLL